MRYRQGARNVGHFTDAKVSEEMTLGGPPALRQVVPLADPPNRAVGASRAPVLSDCLPLRTTIASLRDAPLDYRAHDVSLAPGYSDGGRGDREVLRSEHLGEHAARAVPGGNSSG
jgi:hypothetical protein